MSHFNTRRHVECKKDKLYYGGICITNGNYQVNIANKIEKIIA